MHDILHKGAIHYTDKHNKMAELQPECSEVFTTILKAFSMWVRLSPIPWDIQHQA